MYRINTVYVGGLFSFIQYYSVSDIRGLGTHPPTDKGGLTLIRNNFKRLPQVTTVLKHEVHRQLC